jgi:hypothetical protein
MFDLEREVTAWSVAANTERCRPDAGVAELSDHLYCEIDRARAEGLSNAERLSDEEAFRAAVTRLGSPAELAAEHAKNRSALGAVCRVAAKYDSEMFNPGQRRLLISHSLIWASLMIATSIVFATFSLKAGKGAAAVSPWLITVIYTPLWFASEQLLRRAIRQGATGGAR